MVPVPEWLFRPMVARDAKKLAKKTALETDERRVQHFAVREIPRRREPIAPKTLAAELELSVAEVRQILDELERRMTFLCRRGGEEVVWAYPVTVEETPHQVRMDGGEAFSAA
jgi:transcription initiation factor IIE alpha subunit